MVGIDHRRANQTTNLRVGFLVAMAICIRSKSLLVFLVEKNSYNELLIINNMKKQLSGFENFIYYFFMFATFGGLYIYKVVVKKALCEMVEKS